MHGSRYNVFNEAKVLLRKSGGAPMLFFEKGEWQAMQNKLYLDELKEFEKGRLTR